MHLIGLWKDRRALAVFLFVPIMLRCVVADWHLASIRARALNGRYWGNSGRGATAPAGSSPVLNYFGKKNSFSPN